MQGPKAGDGIGYSRVAMITYCESRGTKSRLAERIQPASKQLEISGLTITPLPQKNLQKYD